MPSPATDRSPAGTGTGVWFVGERSVELRPEPLSRPGPGEVLVEAITSLISAGTEMNVYRGDIGTAAELRLPTSRGTFPFPMQYGYQVVGRVADVGEGTSLSVGDRVFAVHAHQDRFVMPEEAGTGSARRKLATPIPDDLDSERAAFANLFAVALNALLDAPVRFGDVVVVSGLGVVGTFAAYLARRTAGRLILVDPLPTRRDRAAWLEADAVIGPESLAATVEELSAGRGADIAIEASGAASALQGALRTTGDEGTVAVLSYYGTRPVSLQLSPEFHYRRQRIVSSMVGSVGSGLQPRWDRARRTEVAFELLRAIDPAKLATHRMPFAQADQAYRLLNTRPEEILGLLLTYGSDE